jgi:hypothetical protein
LYGLTVALRLHFLPAVIVGIIYHYSKINTRKFWFLMIGFGIPILLSGILDSFTWSYPFQSLWKNFWMNLVEGKSSGFGISPWYQYFGWLLLNWSVYLFVIVFFWSLVFRRHLILTIMALSLIISHSFIAHKEYRFIYGALQIIIILASLGTVEFMSRLRFLKKFSKGEAIAAMISLAIWLTASGFLAERFDSDRSLQLAHLLQKPDITHWTKHRATLLAFEYISQQKDVCGIGVAGIHWSFSGGYSYLHQNVPVYFIEDQLLKNENEFGSLSLYFNYLILYSLEVPKSGYQLIKCYDKMCIYKRPFICLSNPDYHINNKI